MQRWVTKVISGVLMLITTLCCFLLPVKLMTSFRRRGDEGKYYLDILTCFAGGVFFAAYLLFMAPAVRELLIANLMVPYNIDYPLPDLLIGIGFFVLVLANKIVMSISQATRPNISKSKETIKSNQQHHQCSCRQDSKINLSPDAKPLAITEKNDSDVESPVKTSDVIYTFEFDHDVDIKTKPSSGTEAPRPLSRHGSMEDIVNQESLIRSIVLMLALSVDSVLEGVTTGLKTTNVEVWAIFISNFIHEAVISFCLGFQLTKVYTTTRPVIIAAIAYSLMNPIGLAITTAVYEVLHTSPAMDLCNGLFQALTSGCFIYVTFCEIFEGQINNKMSYTKIISAFAGFTLLAAFAAVPGSSSYTEAPCSTLNGTFHLGNSM